MFCRFCGERIIEGSLFCSRCGAKLDDIKDGEGIKCEADNAQTAQDIDIAPQGKSIRLKSPKGEIKEIELTFNSVAFFSELFIGPLFALFYGCVLYAIAATISLVAIECLIALLIYKFFPDYPELQFVCPFIFAIGIEAYIAKTFNKYRVKKLMKNGYICADENSTLVFEKYIISDANIYDV